MLAPAAPAAGGAVAPPTLHVTPRVDKATIYQNKSLQRRCAPLAFVEAVPEVQVMVPMPETAFDRDSLQVEFGVAFDGKIVLAGVVLDTIERLQLRSDGTVDVTAPDVASASDADSDADGAVASASAAARAELEEQLRAVEEKLRHNEIAREECDDECAFKTQMTNAAVQVGKDGPFLRGQALFDEGMWGAQVDSVLATTRAHKKQLRELRCAAAALEEEKTIIKNKLHGGVRVADGGEKPSKVRMAVLTLKVLSPVPAGPEAVVYVSYTVPAGSWRPVYEAHLNTLTNEVDLYYNAEVSMTMDDDLQDVVLTLSSAAPRRNVALPSSTEIWRCGVVHPPPPVPMPRGGAFNCVAEDEKRENMVCGSAMPMMLCCAAPMMRRAEAAVEQVGGGAIMNFTIPNRQTVAASGKSTRVPLTEVRMPARISYTCVPEKSLAAFTQATITNTSDFLLLAGEVAVFLDGNYVTRSHLDKQCVSGGKMEMHFGADPSVEVKRVLLRQTNKVNSSLLKGTETKVKAVTYKITVRNKKRETEAATGTICVKLIEHIPVSSEEQLQVRLVAPQHPYREIYIYDTPEDMVEQQTRKSRLLDNEGIVEIERKIAAGEKTEVLFTYEVEAPRDSTIYGL